jgi:hypothetical protein
VETAAGSEASLDLGALFRLDATAADRGRALRGLADVARSRLRNVRASAGQQGAVVAEQSARLLSELATRLPIRTVEALARECGADPEAQAGRVVDDAARLAGRLALLPPLPGAGAVPVQVVKVVGRSVIEVRMVGELYAIYGDPSAPRNQAWLNTVLQAWALRMPVASTGSAASNTVALGRRIQELVTEAVGAGWLDAGATGSDAVRRLGQRMQRRMRLHPSAWVQPAAETTAAVLRRTIWQEIDSRMPASVAQLARRVRAAESDPGAAAPTSPREALALGWSLHQVAVANASVSPASDPAAERLMVALAVQRRHLDELGRRLGLAAPTGVPVAADGGEGDASRDAWAVEEAIDMAEELGRRSRRLGSWSTRGRAALTYVISAVVVSAPAGAGLWATSGVSKFLLLAAQILLLPWFTLAIGAGLIGLLFKPWLGGRVPRHPVVGMFIAFGVHAVVGLVITALSLLL